MRLTWRSRLFERLDARPQLRERLPLPCDHLLVALAAALRADRGHLRRDATLKRRDYFLYKNAGF